eukprot:scaffold84043_cov16-Prasinocladus_malaysianus.AAC.1
MSDDTVIIVVNFHRLAIRLVIVVEIQHYKELSKHVRVCRILSYNQTCSSSRWQFEVNSIRASVVVYLSRVDVVKNVHMLSTHARPHTTMQ